MGEGSDGTGRVQIAPIEARHLIASYNRASQTFIEHGSTLDDLVREAASLLDRPPPAVPLVELGQALHDDAEHLTDFLEFVERTDGFPALLDAVPSLCASSACADESSRELLSLARLLTGTESIEEIIDAVDAITNGDAFGPEGAFTTATIARELRPIFATAFAIALDHGWWNADLPLYVAAGVPAYGDPSPETMLSLGHLLTTDRGYQPFETSANPFGLPRDEGLFGPVAHALVENPELARRFIDDLLTQEENHAFHRQSAPRSDQLAQLIIAAGSGGPDLQAQTIFANHLIDSLNRREATTSEVFWATWAVHADLALEHNVETTTPTFGVNRAVPEAVRPHWEDLWNDHLGPTVLKFLSGTGRAAQRTYDSFATPLTVNATYNDEVFDPGPGNDPGGTFTTRTLVDAAEAVRVGSITTAPSAETASERGRKAVSQALRDVSPEGPIAADEFAVINHGASADGVSTYSVLLPGVIDLSNPSPGFDPQHASVRDIDEVAIHSAPSASVEDNRYAQLVIAGLEEIGVPASSNVLLIGHSFGADTVLDIAADDDFNSTYNLTHVVAAAYDSVPQLAAVPASIDVLVLQNEDDKVITLERFHRAVGQGDESVSINSFAHDVREFDGGLGNDLGHHPDRYIDYLNNTNDADLDQFLAGLDEAGFTAEGTKVAVDVSITAG